MIVVERLLLLLSIACAVTMIWILLAIAAAYANGFGKGWKGDRDVGDR